MLLQYTSRPCLLKLFTRDPEILSFRDLLESSFIMRVLAVLSYLSFAVAVRKDAKDVLMTEEILVDCSKLKPVPKDVGLRREFIEDPDYEGGNTYVLSTMSDHCGEYFIFLPGKNRYAVLQQGTRISYGSKTKFCWAENEENRRWTKFCDAQQSGNMWDHANQRPGFVKKFSIPFFAIISMA